VVGAEDPFHVRRDALFDGDRLLGATRAPVGVGQGAVGTESVRAVGAEDLFRVGRDALFDGDRPLEKACIRPASEVETLGGIPLGRIAASESWPRWRTTR
jgi:hypothetical protein